MLKIVSITAIIGFIAGIAVTQFNIWQLEHDIQKELTAHCAEVGYITETCEEELQ